MSDSSNEPNREISIYDFFEPTLSVDRIGGFVHVFFGKTPRAQVSIKFEGSLELNPHALNIIHTKFPNARIRYQ